MKNILLLLVVFVSFMSIAQSQENKNEIYNPTADAAQDIAEAVKKAAESKKHVLLQIGGNWCPWCLKLHKFWHDEPQVDSILNADYILVLVNFSKENKNENVMAELGYPTRFGFPVLVILDSKGNRIHTQDSGLLEADKSYDIEKVVRFLKSWNYASIQPGTYK